MQFGFNLPLSGPMASPAMLARLAAEGEAIGYDYAAISDHIVEPIDIHARYPYSESGEFPAGSRGERHEQLTAIAYLAGNLSGSRRQRIARSGPCWLQRGTRSSGGRRSAAAPHNASAGR